ncbi:MAG TPA: endonuclease/exonuclease/phosphatase family protein [Candidatus Binatia bacterium]|jgi:endonuclease/exonuclease/phosphatase family metal-dependent hydrolase
MPDIKVASWNVENLFDTTASEIAADLEFTPANGWTEAAYAAKVKNLADIIKQMHGGQGPDLLGLCEVENKKVVQDLIDAIGRPDYRVAHVDSPDIRGIDATLVYSNQVFKDPLPSDMKGHLVHMRYPTRDIFQVRLEVKTNGAELNVFVNHWPSRKQGQYESEPLRINVAEHCGRLIDETLRFGRADFLALPDTTASLTQLNARWNRNVLVMGDLNDEPFSRSVLNYLLGSKDLDHVEEELKPGTGKKIPEAKIYLGTKAYLFNCMWPLFGRSDKGTFYFFGATNSMNLLDQFLVSRGLFYGVQGLKIDPNSVAIFTPAVMTTPKGRPRAFDRQTKKGYSDHFPIQAVLQTL